MVKTRAKKNAGWSQLLLRVILGCSLFGWYRLGTCGAHVAVNVEVGILHEKLTSLGSPGTRVWSEIDLIWSDNILGVENPFCRICDKFCQMSVWTWMPWMAGLLGTPPKQVASSCTGKWVWRDDTSDWDTRRKQVIQEISEEMSFLHQLSHTPEYPPWPLYIGLCWSAPWQPKLCVQHSFLRSWVVPSWRRIGLIPFSMHVAHRLGLCHCASLCDCGCVVGLQSRLDTSCLCLSVCTGQFGCSKPDGACASSCLGCPDF